METLGQYTLLIAATGLMALLLLVQVLVVDVLGLRAGHRPGSPVEANHEDALFRATRTVANANESIAVFVLAVLFCVFSGASPEYSGYAAMAYVVARALYAICYYSNQQIPRSIVFGVSLACLAALIATGAFT